MTEAIGFTISCIDKRLEWLPTFINNETGLQRYNITLPGGPLSLTDSRAEKSLVSIVQAMTVLGVEATPVSFALVSHCDCGAHKAAGNDQTLQLIQEVHEEAERFLISELRAFPVDFHHFFVLNELQDTGRTDVAYWYNLDSLYKGARPY